MAEKAMIDKRFLALPAVVFAAAALLFSRPVDTRVEIINLRTHTHPTSTRIVIDIGQLREYNAAELTGPDRVYVDIHQAKLNPILHAKSIPVNNGYVKSIRIAQKNRNTVRAAVDLDFSKIKKHHVWHLFDPFRIVIDIYPETDLEAPAAEDLSLPAEPTRAGYSMARQLGLGIGRIVIDPGHGGRDPGCLGRKGTREKTVVLDVAKRLQKLLTDNTRLEVVLTRESDILIPVEERTVIANQKRADIFISIHANANPRKNYSGVATFYLNFSRDPSVMATAARENATSTKNIGEMTDIIRKITRNSKIAESRDLAEKIQASLVGRLKTQHKSVRDHGVRGGPFWVLIGGEMPSVLVEISHLSNATEESRLRTETYRQHVARGIYDGILKYINSLGKGSSYEKT